MKKVVIFGAGQIGKGFIGDICHSSGYFLVFIDADQKVVDLLNEKKEYPIWLLRDEKVEKKITHLKSYHISETESISDQISDVDLVFTAVGVNNLTDLIPVLIEGIKKKVSKDESSYLNIVICENLLGSSRILKNGILELLPDRYISYLNNNVGFVESVVSRMVAPVPDHLLKKYPLIVTVEPYDKLPVDKKAFRGEIPAIRGLKPVVALPPYVELKLYMHNLSHACQAYTGYLKGYTYIWECMYNEEMKSILNGVIGEAKAALISKHGFEQEEIDNYIADLLERYRNKSLNDTVCRVGRDPIRKLGRDDRLSGSIHLCLSQNIFPDNICYLMAACLCFNCENDEHAVELQKIIANKGIEFILRNISKINDNRVVQKVKKYYMEIKSESRHTQEDRRSRHRRGEDTFSK
jgi:mannitol-1-phosphate 5-dehydrogenase